ncbi:MAG: tetratricopeptide repeat protein [Thalassovita sp.]
MRQILIPIVLSLYASSVSAEDCPAAPDHDAELTALLTEVRDAHNELAGRLVTNKMWALWAQAPNEVAQEVLDRGMRKRRSYDFLGAIQDFDRLIAYCPHYAEGYNQRGFVLFIQQDYAAALADLEQALALSPNHVAALAGKALTLMGLGRMDEGQEVLRMALELNPWLPERRLAQTPPGLEL